MAFNPPTKVTVCREPDSLKVDVTWKNAKGAGGTQIRVSPTGGIRAVTGSSETVRSLKPGQTYSICVRHVYGRNYSAWVCANVTISNPGKPDRPTITLTPLECGLNVQVNPGGSVFVRKYAIFRKSPSGAWKLWRGPLGGDVPTCTGFTRKIPDALPDNEPKCRIHCYYGVAINNVGPSGNGDPACGSSPASGTFLPDIVLSATPLPCQVKLTWTVGELPCGMSWGVSAVLVDGVEVAAVGGGARTLTLDVTPPEVDATFVIHAKISGGDCEKSSNIVTAASLPCGGGIGGAPQ